MKTTTFCMSLMFTSAILHAGWFFNYIDSTTGTITDNNWILKVSYADGSDLLTITGVNGVTTETVLPLRDPVDNGKTIVGIGNNIFQNKAIETVTLPDSLESIGTSAFEGCGNLVDIYPFLPNSVKSIGGRVFVNCYAITNALMLSNENLTALPDYVFFNCYKIPSVDMSGTKVASIGNGTFYQNTQCRDFFLSDCLEFIDESAFYGCGNLVNITPFLPDTVTTIRQNVFNTCGAITNALILSNKNLTTVPSATFANMKNLHSVDMSGSGVTKIGDQAFEGDYEIVSVILSDYLESIGLNAFYYCSNVVHISPFLPDTVSGIGKNAFDFCKAVTNALVLSNMDLTAISNAVFNSMQNLHSVDMSGSGVKTIGEQAFDGGSKITSVKLSNYLESLAKLSFRNCGAIVDISPFLPNTVTNIGEQAFNYCHAITNALVLSNPNLTALSGWVFNCGQIPSVLFGEGIVDLTGDVTFYQAKSITQFWFTGDLPAFRANVFPMYDFELVARFYIPKGNETWEQWVGANVTLLNDTETNNYLLAYPDQPLPLGKFYPASATRYQYLCTWKPPKHENLITVIILK